MIEKFLFQPVSPFRVNQYFGEDQACLSLADNKTIVTKETSATCPAGYKSLYANTNGHNGLDIRAKRWQPIYAAHDGIIAEVQTEVERGLGVGIVSNEKRYFTESNSKELYKTRYWHFIAFDVHLGDKVKCGDFIGYADSTGYSTGDHLHFELKPVTIIDYENGVPVVKNTLQTNGKFGAVNPLPYMEMIPALQFAGIIRQVTELTARVADFIADFLRR
mgnify:CR=1 FL=1